MDVALVGPLLPGVENHSLARLEHVARKAGFETRLVDLSSLGDLDAALAAVLADPPALCGISVQSTEAALASISLAWRLRHAGFQGRIVCGGHFATLNAEQILESPAGVDAVVRFAGEEALVGLLRGASSDEELGALPGLVFRGADGQLRQGAPGRVAGDGVPRAPLGDRPLPEHLGFPAADLVTSRGCEARCAYCCVAATSELERREAVRGGRAARTPSYARRSAEHIAEEIAVLYHERGARVFNFMDDNLLPLEPERALEFIDALAAGLDTRGVGRIALSLQLRADVVTPAVADALVELGLVRAYVGIDAASAGQLRALGRRTEASAGAQALSELWQRGVFSVCNALLIGPTFGFEKIQGEIEALSALRHAPLHLLPLDVRAGTALSARAEKLGLVSGNFLWRHYRFLDERTELLGQVVVSLPTRLAERSVPIALYDLGYNLGIARRLLPELRETVDRLAALYERVAEAWNADQIRVLLAASELAATRNRDGIASFIAAEQERVREHDEALLAECDAALRELERKASAALGAPAAPHVRGLLLSVALSLGMAACGGISQASNPASGGAGGSGGSGVDASAGAGGGGGSGGIHFEAGPVQDAHFDVADAAACSNPGDAGLNLDASADSAVPDAGLCPDGTAPKSGPAWDFLCGLGTGPQGCGFLVQLTFDANGVLSAVDSTGFTPKNTLDCITALLGKSCYPALACTTQQLVSHCWVA